MEIYVTLLMLSKKSIKEMQAKIAKLMNIKSLFESSGYKMKTLSSKYTGKVSYIYKSKNNLLTQK